MAEAEVEASKAACLVFMHSLDKISQKHKVVNVFLIKFNVIKSKLNDLSAHL